MTEPPSSFESYPREGILTAQAALVETWSLLENFHEDLVLVGGLAVYQHTKEKPSPRYRPTPTLDVDFGIALAADTGLCATAAFALEMAGFKQDEKGRLFRKSEHGILYLDFLTEHPPATQGTRNVSDLITSLCPGINRALDTPIKRTVKGLDQYGDERTFHIPICDYGPLLVLKLNAFANRSSAKKSKDAYDILSLVYSCLEGPEAAIASFGREKSKSNEGMKSALQALESGFLDSEQEGPVRAAHFYYGEQASKEDNLRLREELVTVARALLDA